MTEHIPPGSGTPVERLKSNDAQVRAEALQNVYGPATNGLLLTVEADGAVTCAAFGVFGPREWVALLAVVQQLGNQMGLGLQWVKRPPTRGGLVLPSNMRPMQ